MSSVEQLQREIAQLKKDEADLRKKLSDAQGAAAKDVAAARRKRESALRASSLTSAQSYLREAERLEKHAADLTKKAADIASKLADNSKRQGDKVKALASAERETQRRRDREDERRRQTEKQHAQEVARLSRPTVRYVHEVRMIEPPKPERLRVLDLAANPEMDVRVDAEVRQVRAAVKKALHRDLVDIDHRPAATPEDLLDGINELRPHVIHFAGHEAAALWCSTMASLTIRRDVLWHLSCSVVRLVRPTPRPSCSCSTPATPWMGLMGCSAWCRS